MGCCNSAQTDIDKYDLDYDSLNKCDEIDFFNRLQFHESLCIDGQNSSFYQKCHIKYSLNIQSETDKNGKIQDAQIVIPIIEAKRNLSLCKHICLYVNDINNENEKNFILRTIFLLLKHKIITDIKTFYILSVSFDKFQSRFPFYCNNLNNDQLSDKINEQYPNIIIPNRLYLGDATQSQNKIVINDLNITHILNVTKDWNNKFENDTNIKYLRIAINDNETDDIFQHFENAIDFIESSNICFVHCQAGVSRSVSIIIAYIMKTRNINY